jgi:hypothetical protein
MTAEAESFLMKMMHSGGLSDIFTAVMSVILQLCRILLYRPLKQVLPLPRRYLNLKRESGM